ncbi:hypothetical protein BKA70DRAFT_1326919 [Coprinopsis sp. MPI-PUGE-AT-0042]|nr:hypothetical protein BKA70DRAFT_1326919 [Coprinopsis sp. MPI-PUGE-AT-0042]
MLILASSLFISSMFARPIKQLQGTVQYQGLLKTQKDGGSYVGSSFILRPHWQPPFTHGYQTVDHASSITRGR